MSAGPAARWFDSHCHLQGEYLPRHEAAADRPSGPSAWPDELVGTLARSAAAGVDAMVCIGTDAASSEQALALARAARRGDLGADVPALWATAGLHPHQASEGTGAVGELIGREAATADGTLVAVGECGLDYHYEHSPRTDQRRAFAEQIALAGRHSLALVIHARDAWDDLFDVLGSEGVPARTVLHCFTGGPAELDRCLEVGMYVSFSGIVTFKNALEVSAAATRCPLDRLLVETDSPFLAPVPHRGRPNEPAYVALVGAAVAALRGIEASALAGSTDAAARRAFAI
jgi:TatD DNase family protein